MSLANGGIKPIPCEYNGYHFRSRLEARWAIYFETLGIPYDYELEGFEVARGVCYLPDFQLPEHHCFAEVKPIPLNQLEFDKACAFVETTGQDLLLLVGAPNYTPYCILRSGEYFPCGMRGPRLCRECGVVYPFDFEAHLPESINIEVVELWYGWKKDHRFWSSPCGGEATAYRGWYSPSDGIDPVLASRHIRHITRGQPRRRHN